jgi:hypothetical protein
MGITAKGRLFAWGGGYEGTRPVCGHGSNDGVLMPKQVAALSDKVVVQLATVSLSD